MSIPNVIDILQERGFIEALTSEEIRTMAANPLKVYCGFDPSSDSLHLGNLVAIMGLAWFQRCGHSVVALIGGATGMIGDPSGKSHERQLLDEQTIQTNLKGIRKNLESVLNVGDFAAAPTIVNNLDWFKDYSFIAFLRDIGKYFRIGVMLAKDSVKTRLSSEEGMSFTEFSYQLLQGYDFLYLFDHLGVTIQLGGSDQWGNIIAGTDLIRKARSQSACGVTFPLLVRSDGQKFGKSEKGAIWLSKEKLSPYEFYQYLYRIPDADVIKLMRLLTFMDMAEIYRYEEFMHAQDYVVNTAQKRLAEEVTRIVHGNEGLATALKVTEGAAPGSHAQLSSETLESIAADMPNATLSKNDVVGEKLIELVVKVGLQTSKGEVKRLIRNGGVYLNNKQINDENTIIANEHLIDDKMLLVSLGKKNKMLIKVYRT